MMSKIPALSNVSGTGTSNKPSAKGKFIGWSKKYGFKIR
jgi:hypothetical protein